MSAQNTVTAFGSFRDGLITELVRRTARMGEACALLELESERQKLAATANRSQLQKLASKYFKLHRVKRAKP